jgi:hypothetical protein
MLQEILMVAVLVGRVVMLYVLPIFKTFKLQSLPIETQSVANREMLLYWIILIWVLLLERALWFLNEYPTHYPATSSTRSKPQWCSGSGIRASMYIRT